MGDVGEERGLCPVQFGKSLRTDQQIQAKRFNDMLYAAIQYTSEVR
jgi:hypothetical protein